LVADADSEPAPKFEAEKRAFAPRAEHCLMNAILSFPPVDSPDDLIAPKDRRRAWVVEWVQGIAAALGVLGFNLESSHSVSQWVMAIAFQLALLAGAEFLKIPFAIKCRTAETPARRAGAGLGLMCGTAISAIALYMAGVTAFAPRHAALEQAQIELATAERNDAAFQALYKAKIQAVAAAQKLVDGDTARSSGASGDYATARLCDRRGRRCHGDPKLSGNLDDANATKDADRKALADAKGELAKLDPSVTASVVQAKESALRSASREDLFSRMATELIGEDNISPKVMMWVRRSVAMMCIFAAMAGSLYAFCSVKAPAKPAPPVRARSAEQIELLMAGASEIAREAKTAVVSDVVNAFKSASVEAKSPAPADGNAPKKSPLGEVLSDFLAKAKRPRGRPRKDKGNGAAAAPAKAAPPRKRRQAPEGENPPLQN
jgi:hypothetical protein